MSLPLYSITCTRCELNHSFMPYGTSYRYRLDDNSEIHAKTGNGWCMRCDGPEKIQSVLLPDQLQERCENLAYRLTNLEKPKFLGVFRPGLSPQERVELEDIREEIDWLMKLRQLIGNEVIAARCLKCDSTAVSEFSLPDYGCERHSSLPFTHPGCGGQLLIAEIGRISVGPRSSVFISLRPHAKRAEQPSPLSSRVTNSIVNKNELIACLVGHRIRSDPMARQMGFDETIIKSLRPDQLAGLPESTIITIVETWATLLKKGFSEAEIFARIEEHRSRVFPRGCLPSPLTLADYVKYRIRLEHAHGAPIDESFVEAAIDTAIEAYW